MGRIASSESDCMTTQKKRAFELSIKAAEGDDAENYGYFEGYGSVFGVVDSYRERVEKGAFVESLKKKMPKLLLQHRPDRVIGKFLEAYEDEKGLYVKGRLNLNVQDAREAYHLIKDGSFSGMSIGFNVRQHEVEKETGVVKLLKIDLWEVSLVTFPANEDANVESVKTAPKTIRAFEEFLRDAGYSRSDAEDIALNGYRSYEARRDGGDLSGVEAALKGVLQQLRKSLPNDGSSSEAR